MIYLVTRLSGTLRNWYESRVPHFHPLDKKIAIKALFMQWRTIRSMNHDLAIIVKFYLKRIFRKITGKDDVLKSTKQIE